jgi:hypothetical protein
VSIVHDGVETRRSRSPAAAVRWGAARRAVIVAAGAALCLFLVWGGLRWPMPLPAVSGPFPGQDTISPGVLQPFVELLKLVVAALIGLLVTVVHRPASPAQPFKTSLEQAQVLLCVAGAMMMIIIGNSLARAFGIAGAAAIIRFRTPVEDPKDVTILFLLMGLGMAAGIGAFAVAGLGAASLSVFLLMLDRFAWTSPRAMMVKLVADTPLFPRAHVQDVFAFHRVSSELREVSQGERASAKYQATVLPGTVLEDVSADLLAGGAAGLRSVSWEPARKRAQ